MIRRVMTDYFQIDVDYVMGVTDIDDKIVNRAKREIFELPSWRSDTKSSSREIWNLWA